jgi:hypothetical protein
MTIYMTVGLLVTAKEAIFVNALGPLAAFHICRHYIDT